jgi:hypothetical protein
MRRLTPSLRSRLALGASVGLLAVLLSLRFLGSAKALPPEPALQALRAEHARLSSFSRSALDALRRERDLLRAPPSAGETLPSGWSEQVGEGHATYRYGGEPSLTWIELVHAIGIIERRSGGRIVGLDVRSRGSRETREIAAVEIVAGAPATVRPRADAPSPGAAGPAQPRKAGRVRSLRRPSAFADRQAARLRLPARPPLASDPALRGSPANRSHPSAKSAPPKHHPS